MDTRFALHVKTWLPGLLRQKAVASASDHRLAMIGAADLSMMFSNYLLEVLGEDPRSCLTCCGLDDVTDSEILELTGLDRYVLAAAFIGAVVELSAWFGDDGVSFMISHGVPEEDAIEFAHAVEVTCDKLGARGQALVAELTGRAGEIDEVRIAEPTTALPPALSAS